MSPIGRSIALLAVLAGFPTHTFAAATADLSVGVLWPERQRSFLQDGPGFLLSAEQVEELAALDTAGRQAWIESFLANDPDPSTPVNELAEGVQRRKALLQREFLSPRDVRAQLLFLHGEPDARQRIDCLTTFKPLEIWTYGRDSEAVELVLYRPGTTLPFRLWLPWDSKAILYTSEMEYYLRQWDELRSRIRPGVKRFDRQLCAEARRVDRVTGFDGISQPLDEAPASRGLSAFLEPPEDLAAWAESAAATAPTPAPEAELEVADVELLFPEREGQRMRTRVRLTLPPDASLEVAVPGEEEAEAEESVAEEGETGDEEAEDEDQEPQTLNRGDGMRVEVRAPRERDRAADLPPAPEADEPELRVALDGVIERDDEIFEDFRLRFRLSPEVLESGEPIALDFDRKLRPDTTFVLRMRLEDEVGGAVGYVARGFQVPRLANQAHASREATLSAGAIAEDIVKMRIAGADSLHLVPPGDQVILTHWRAEALVTGDRIEKVAFFVDEQLQLTRTQPPFTAELRLADYPEELVVRAEGYDATGELVAADEVVLNQPRGAFRVRIQEPARGRPAVATDNRLPMEVEVVVPEGQRVERVELRVNDEVRQTLTAPPWRGVVELPPPSEITYVSAVAFLDNGRQQEDLRILNAPGFVEQVDVDLVELYTTVTDRNGRLLRGLPQSAFRVLEDGRPQKIAQFEEVENLPLTLGIAIDISGSMGSSLPVAVDAAGDFLNAIITPRDTCFLLSFADAVRLEMAPTDDPAALEAGMSGLAAEGWTALYDAVVAGLYYFRGNSGRRALILLSDGEDTASRYDYQGMLEYARRSGVTIYTVALDVPNPNGRGGLGRGARNRLRELARETGGRSFTIRAADQLTGVYQEIEDELRSQYLIAYAPDGQGEPDTFREVEVEVEGGEARTIRGYYR